MNPLFRLFLKIMWMLPVAVVHAQPYAFVSIGANGGFDVLEGEFGRAWDVSPAGLLSASTPFHLGQIEAGAMGFRSDDGDGMDDFSAGLFFAGWGPSIQIGSTAEWHTTAYAGDLLMLFDEGASGYSRRENELALGVKTSVVFLLTRHLELEAGMIGFRAFTVKPVDLVFVSAGLRYRLQTSPQVRAWLQ